MEITVYRSTEELKNNRFLLRAVITHPETFDFNACVSMFKNLYPDCTVVFKS